jgi:hypothetical protein
MPRATEKVQPRGDRERSFGFLIVPRCAATRSEQRALLRKAPQGIPGSSASTGEETQQVAAWPSAGKSCRAGRIAQKSETEIECLIRIVRRKWNYLRGATRLLLQIKRATFGSPFFVCETASIQRILSALTWRAFKCASLPQRRRVIFPAIFSNFLGSASTLASSHKSRQFRMMCVFMGIRSTDSEAESSH